MGEGGRPKGCMKERNGKEGRKEMWKEAWKVGRSRGRGNFEG
jgi:hypothetical protein